MAGIVAPVVDIDNIFANEDICVGRHAVTPVPVRGPDEKGVVTTRNVFPLSNGCAFREKNGVGNRCDGVRWLRQWSEIRLSQKSGFYARRA